MDGISSSEGGFGACPGERGPVWWSDGSPDYNRKLAKNSPYAAWWAEHARAVKASPA
jgi:hypothetical protein